MNRLWQSSFCFAAAFHWCVPVIHAQSSLAPVLNPAGLEDQRLNLLSPEGYQLIEQANQALQSGLYRRAEDRMVQLLYQHTDSLVPLPRIQEFPLRNFASVPEFVNAWYSQLPDDFSARDQDRNKRSEAVRMGLVPSLEFARFFPQHITSSDWDLVLCDELMNRAELEAARIFLHRYKSSPVIGLNRTYTGKWQPDFAMSKDAQLRIGVRRVVLDVLEGREVVAKELLEALTENGTEDIRSLGGLNGTWQSLLEGFFQQHFGGTRPVTQFLPESVLRRNSSRIFESGELWRCDISALVDERGLEQKLDVRFKVVGDQLFANTMNGILALNLTSGQPLFGEGDEAYWLLRGHQQEVAGWFDSQIPYWGNSTPVVDVVGDLLAARQGDPALTHHQSVESGDIQGNSIVVLDLAEEGRMLEGFPLKLPVAQSGSYQVFATAPRIVGEQLLVGIRENQAFQCRHYLASYDLSGGTLNWRCFVGAARPIANRTITDLVSCGLDVIGAQAIFTTNTGMVASVDLSGQLNWVCSYPRTYHPLPSAELETRVVRRSTAGFDRNAMAVVVAPADSEIVFSLDLRTGLALNVFRDPSLALAEVYVTPCGQMLLSGDSLWQMHTADDSKRVPLLLQSSEVKSQHSICIDGDRVYRVNGSQELYEVSWDRESGKASVHQSSLDISNAHQIQMNQRLAILFDGKMLKAFKAVPAANVNEK